MQLISALRNLLISFTSVHGEKILISATRKGTRQLSDNFTQPPTASCILAWRWILLIDIKAAEFFARMQAIFPVVLKKANGVRLRVGRNKL